MKKVAYSVFFALLIVNTSGQVNLEYTNEVMSNTGIKQQEEETKITSVAIYGAGQLFGLASSDNTPAGSSPASGSLGISFKSINKRWAFNFFYSINGVTEIDVSSFANLGAALQAPNNSGNSIQVNVVKRAGWSAFGHPDNFGWIFDFSFTDNIWNIDSVTSYNLSPIVFKAGGYYRPFNFDISPNKLNIYGTFLYTYRGAAGDLFNGRTETITIEEEEYTLRAYHGFELGLHALFNNVALYALVPINFTDKELPGFTGVQFIVGVKVSGDIIKLEKSGD